MAADEDDSFPMLQLPLTMKDMVLPKLSVLDLYNLSHVSEDAKNWVKDYVRNKKYRLKIQAKRYFEVSLHNSHGQGFDLNFEIHQPVANAEFNFGDFIVFTKNETTALNRVKISVLTKKLDMRWKEDQIMKSFIKHLLEVFTRDVCIQIDHSSCMYAGYNNRRKEKIVMGFIKDFNLKVHCFKTDQNYALPEIKGFTRYPRMFIDHGNVTKRQVKLLFEQWMKHGIMDYFEIRILPEVIISTIS